MPIRGTPRVFHKKFAFQVEIEGVVSARFTKSSSLEAEIAKIEQWEGGSVISDKSPGRVTVSDVTLERGTAHGDSDLYQWWQAVVRMSAGTGLPTPDYKRPVDLINLDRDGSVKRRWLCEGAWPVKMVVGEWDNEADENVVEMLTFTMDTFDLVEDRA